MSSTDLTTGTPAARKTDWTSIDTPIKHAGKEITLPSTPTPMDYDSAIATLERVKEQENQKFDAHEMIVGAPWDALVAVYKSMQSIYGVVLAQSIKTFFGDILPDMVTIHTGPNPQDVIQVPMGQMSLPGVSEPVRIVMTPNGVAIVGKVRRKDRATLVEIANKAREFMRIESIYRGKAIRLGVDEEGNLQTAVQPEYLQLARVQESDMIHSAETAAQIRTSILAPLKNTEACRKHKIPLKRGILLEGKYGTGKSLTARVTAKVATDNGWTFITLDRSQGLKAAIEFARTYQPCVIFAEDIDRSADRQDEDVNDLVNLLDGMISKDMEMMVVLTTNFVEKIDRALLRPGRFDAIVSIQPPDAEAAEKLIRHYAGPLLDSSVGLTLVGEAIAGWIPATIREVVERAKLSMLVEDRPNLNAEDLITSATGMKRHMELLNPVVSTETPADRLYKSFSEVVAAGFGGGDGEPLSTEEQVQRLQLTVEHAQSRLNQLQGHSRQILDVAQGGANSATQAKENTDKLLRGAGGGKPGGFTLGADGTVKIA